MSALSVIEGGANRFEQNWVVEVLSNLVMFFIGSKTIDRRW